MLNRARHAWRVFRHGYPSSPVRLEAKQKLPFTWPAWRENTPQWHTTSFEAYVTEGFNLNSILYSAIMYKVRSKMAAPLRAYQGDPRSPELLSPDDPLAQLVARPNPHQSWAEFQALNEIFFNLGQCYILMHRPRSGGLPTAMYSLRPDRVWIVPKDQTVGGYFYVPEGRSVRDGVSILPQDMMHVKLPNPNDPLEGMGYGMPPTPIGQSADVDNEVTRFLKLFFQNGAMITGLLKFEQPLDDEVMAEVRRRWREIYGGVEGWQEVGVLDRGGSYERVGATFDEMGFNEIDERNESRILGPLGVPPILIGSRTGLARSTYSNYDLARRSYWEDTAVPEIRMFEVEYQYYLRDEEKFVKFDLSQVPALQQDMPGLIKAARVLWSMGVPAQQAFQAVGLHIDDVPGGDVGYLPNGVFPVNVAPVEEEQTMEGAAEAEEDERKLAPNRNGHTGWPKMIEVKNLSSFRNNLRAAVRALWSGVWVSLEFLEAMESTINRGFNQAWREGAASCGVGPDEMTDQEQTALDGAILNELVHIADFADAIEAGNRDRGGKLGPFYSRLELWANAYNRTRALAQSMACADRKLTWVLGPTEHCVDCANMADRVYRGSVWNANGVLPQTRGLACGGWRCQCSLEPTDEQITRGRMPGLRGKAKEQELVK